MRRPAHLLRDTLEVALLDPSFGSTFFERLFAAHPHLRARFVQNSAGAQQKMFAQKLCAVVDGIEDPEALAREARAIARTHRGYGATLEMYTWVGDALIETLRVLAADEWSDEAEVVWRGAYGALVRAISEASAA
jgi:hemoglobin-like flavoprotein